MTRQAFLTLRDMHARHHLISSDVLTAATDGAAEVANADAWGCQPGALPSLARFAVELDQRFLTELAHTTVLFNELFDQSGRRQLIKVAHFTPPQPAHSMLALWDKAWH